MQLNEWYLTELQKVNILLETLKIYLSEEFNERSNKMLTISTGCEL